MHKTLTLILVAVTCWLGLGAQAQPAPQPGQPLPYAATADAATFSFQFGRPDDLYLETMRDRYGLGTLVADKTTDLAKAQAVCAWVHNRLDHNGHIPTKKTDPMGILQDAQLEQQVQCVGFGIVLAAALQSVGIPARPLYLKMADSETRGSAAGHAATEAWLKEQQKWVLVDAQWDVIPLLNGTPLNAVELQQALATEAPGLRGLTSTDAKWKFYFKWLRDYLYYLDTPLDNRFGTKTSTAGLMLVPVGAKKPVVFQRTTRLHNLRYTHSPATFYADPYETYQAQEPPAPAN
ncbi:transglutaminase family protein [Hymenobacter sp. B81]|uniref:transglutaminase family protein n=1 Tax=Hymenobacter sp. B81 TaxID=3344878 RepID=UPI0037DD6C89